MFEIYNDLCECFFFDTLMKAFFTALKQRHLVSACTHDP